MKGHMICKLDENIVSVTAVCDELKTVNRLRGTRTASV